MGRSEMRWSEMQESDGVALGLLDGGGGRGRRGPRLIWVSRSHSCQGRAAAGGNSWLQPALLPTLLMEPTNHPSPASPAPSRDNAHRSIPPPRNWWMLADIIWQLCQLSPRHLQHQQETGAKKRNRWENVAAVQEPRKLYFRQLRRSSKNRNTHLRMRMLSQRIHYQCILQPSDENQREDYLAEYIFPTASIAQNPYCQIPAWYFLSPLDLPWSPWMMPNAPIIVKFLGSKHFSQFIAYLEDTSAMIKSMNGINLI